MTATAGHYRLRHVARMEWIKLRTLRSVRSNAGIAGTLVLTLGTVEKHVASIFAKLGLPASESDNRRVLAVLRHLGDG